MLQGIWRDVAGRHVTAPGIPLARSLHCRPRTTACLTTSVPKPVYGLCRARRAGHRADRPGRLQLRCTPDHAGRRRALHPRVTRPLSAVPLWTLLSGCDRAPRSRLDGRAQLAKADARHQGAGHALRCAFCPDWTFRAGRCAFWGVSPFRAFSGLCAFWAICPFRAHGSGGVAENREEDSRPTGVIRPSGQRLRHPTARRHLWRNGLRSVGSNNLPIWVRGTVASEPALLYVIDDQPLPLFLVDARTRKGQSGAPVIIYRRPLTVLGTPTGHLQITKGTQSKLLGVYSGRVNAESDLGFVWRIGEVDLICRKGVQGTRDPAQPTGAI